MSSLRQQEGNNSVVSVAQQLSEPLGLHPATQLIIKLLQTDVGQVCREELLLKDATDNFPFWCFVYWKLNFCFF